MVIREDREKLIELINKYLYEEITAFEFDEKLFDSKNSKDKTVEQLKMQLWQCYDDCKDHKIVASKEMWDYLQRILLLLESDGELEWIKQRKWHYIQLIALLLLPLSIGIFFFTNDIYWGILANVIMWPFSYLIHRIRCGLTSSTSTFPYKNTSQILSAKRTVSDFKKEAYPHSRLRSRKIRSRGMEILTLIPMYIGWIVFCPLVFLFQTRPINASFTQVK